MAQRRTDLAQESHELWQESAGKTTTLRGVRAEDGETEGFSTHRVSVLDEEGAAAIGKPVGQYITLELDGLLRREEDAFYRAARAVARLLSPLLPREGLALVAGLGNGADTLRNVVTHIRTVTDQDAGENGNQRNGNKGSAELSVQHEQNHENGKEAGNTQDSF